MQINKYTDFSFRVLIYLASKPEKNKLVTIKELSVTFKISKNHLMKVVHRLGQVGFIKTVSGKKGGITLNHPPEKIRLNDVFNAMEMNLNLVECFDKNTQRNCVISPACRLQFIFKDALHAFQDVLSQYTLKDALINPHFLKKISNL